MKTLKLMVSSLLSVLLLVGCGGSNPEKPQVAVTQIEGCPGSLPFSQKLTIGVDSKTKLKILSDLTSAFVADATKLKNLTKAEIKASLKSDFAKELNSNVKQESKFSDSFWEQEASSFNLLCMIAQSKEKARSPEERKAYTTQEIKLFDARRDYIYNVKKKQPTQ